MYIILKPQIIIIFVYNIGYYGAVPLFQAEDGEAEQRDSAAIAIGGAATALIALFPALGLSTVVHS